MPGRTSVNTCVGINGTILLTVTGMADAGQVPGSIG